MKFSNILVTGGCGFIGSNFVRFIAPYAETIVVVDKLTYAANLDYLKSLKYIFYKNDIKDDELLIILRKHNIDAVINFAAETHVDRSILLPSVFIDTNINSTFSLIENCLAYQKEKKSDFRFIHISTDEIFGDLGMYDEDVMFTEDMQYKPSSPYSSSKAAINLIINSYVRTFDFNAIIVCPTNNFGPNQFREKLIPTVIDCCINRLPIPIYGNGKNIREWLFVDDCCLGIYNALLYGVIGESYLLGSGNVYSNIQTIDLLCTIISDKLAYDCLSLKSFVADRVGHDIRYTVDFTKASKQLGFKNNFTYEQGMNITIDSYLK